MANRPTFLPRFQATRFPRGDVNIQYMLLITCVSAAFLAVIGILVLMKGLKSYDSFVSFFLILLSFTILGGSLWFYFRAFSATDYAGKLGEALRISGDPYLIVNEEGETVYFNKAFQAYFPNIERKTFEEIAGDLDPSYQKEIFDAEHPDYYVKKRLVLSPPGEKKKYYLKCYWSQEEGIFLWRLDDVNDYIREFHDSINEQSFFLKDFNVREIFDLTPAGIAFIDREGLLQVYNQTFAKKFLKRDFTDIKIPFESFLTENNKDHFRKVYQAYLTSQEEGASVDLEFIAQPDIKAIAFIGRLTLEREGDTPPKGAALFIFDNTGQQRLQLQLIQSQKLQALGQLAGGIAHDFNNLLTAMIGFCDLLLNRHSPGDQSFTDIMQIKQNANRAANLVRQLLAFSRRQTLQPKILDIGEVLSGLSLLLQRLIGAQIKLKMIHGRTLGFVRVDEGQLEQVIINLVVNARDAIQDQGEIIIRTFNRDLTRPEDIGHEIIPVGSYIVMEVIDTGHGMTKEQMAQIFDPFYSTKDSGLGTGLGLSTVYGIVKQTGGYIFVESKIDRGTQFSIYLPQHKAQIQDMTAREAEKAPQLSDLTGQGTVLLVEDEDAVRIFSARALRDKGYRVIEANSGESGLEVLKMVAEKKHEPIHLIITDVVMPHMDGPTMIREATKILKDLKVIYTSGYAEDSFRQEVDSHANIHFLPKPYSLKVLATKTKEVLEGKSEPQKALLGATRAHRKSR